MNQKKSKDYWEKRARENENKVYKQGTELVKELNSSYIRARREIQKSINDLVARYMDKTNLSYAEAVKNLTSSEFKEWRMGLEEYEKEIERLSKFSPTLSKLLRIELETLATKSQITRLDILKAQIDFELNKKGVTEQEVIEKGIGTVYKDFYKMYTAEFGLTGINTVLPKKTVERLMQQPWSGANFSERIWSNREALGNTLKQEIIQSFMQGISVNDLSDRIQKRFEADRYNTERLVRTELNYALNETTRLSYEEAEIGEYEFLAEIDNRTSKQCRELNGQKFKLKDAKVGINYPPMHPHCRSTTVPVIDYESIGKKKEKKKVIKNDTIKVDKGLYPDELAGINRGKPMNREKANQGNANPKIKLYYEGRKKQNYKMISEYQPYTINCQTCVVAFEARLRGYDVEALPNIENEVIKKLSKKTNLAWIDPKTGKNPEYIKSDTETTAKKFFKFLQETIKPKERYTIEFGWKGRGNSGHIISLDRDDKGELRFYDPQIGESYGEKEIQEYLKHVRYVTTIYGTKIPIGPKILRIDDKYFSKEVVDKILKGADK